jgi:hypothetical protein
VILELQDELRDLENKLKKLDDSDLENGNIKRLMSRKDELKQAKREKTGSARLNLIETIRGKLVEYGE